MQSLKSLKHKVLKAFGFWLLAFGLSDQREQVC
jgi:hypothetical protein